jgi:hypothetical protein
VVDARTKGLVGVEQRAELRREDVVRGVSIKELAPRTGMSRNAVRAALRPPGLPRYERASTAWVVVTCLGYSRAGAGTLIFWIRQFLWSLGGCPRRW